MSPLFLLWLGGPLHVPTVPLAPAVFLPLVVSQDTDPAAAVVHIEYWQELIQGVVSVERSSPRRGEPVVPSAELAALEEQAMASPPWPGEDPIAEAVLSYIGELQRLEMEVSPQLVELLHSEHPRDADLAAADALWQEMTEIRVGGWDLVSQAVFEFAGANGVRMDAPAPSVRPAPTGEELPGGAMFLPVAYRMTLAGMHLSDVRGICNQGVIVMNQAVRLSATPDGDLRPLAESLAQARAEMDAVPAWVGDAEFRNACSAVLESQAGILEQGIPAMQEALAKGDTETFNSAARDQSAELRILQLDLHDAEASFRVRWGLQTLEAPPKQTDNTGADQALARMRHWSGLVGQAVLLSTQVRINLLLDGVEFEDQSKQTSLRLAELQVQAENPPPFKGDDPLRKPAIAVLDVLEQSYGDWGDQAFVLLHTPKPREADQRRYQALVKEEALATKKAVSAYRDAHSAFGEAHGIRMVSTQTMDSLHPPSFVVTLPGPNVELPAQVRIAFAAGHMMEVSLAFTAGLDAWNVLVAAPADAWPELLPQTRAVVSAALNEVLSIPPWMGEETMVQVAGVALGTWLETLDKNVPRMIELLSGDRSKKDVNQYNKLLEELNQNGEIGVAEWNAANTQWAQDWQFASSQAHQEAMVQWARDSRELLKSP